MKGPVPGFDHDPHPQSNRRGGVYLLIMYIPSDILLRVGTLGEIKFLEGTYIYTGSAKRGIYTRAGRHFKREKEQRWHIDHLSNVAESMGIWWKEYSQTGECDAARYLSERYDPVRSFGSSDCSCGSHLFHARRGRKWL